MNSKYNVGDIVRVISDYAPGLGSGHYLCEFPPNMLEETKGKVVRISEVIPRERPPYKKLSTDEYVYNVVDLYSNKIINWRFSAEMFEDSNCLEIV